MFSDKYKDKCLYYARWLCLKDDGVFVRVVWQVQADRTDAKGSGTDQWIGMTREVPNLMHSGCRFTTSSKSVSRTRSICRGMMPWNCVLVKL